MEGRLPGMEGRLPGMEGRLPGMEGRLPFDRVDSGKQFIVKPGAHLLGQPHIDVAVGECRVGNTRGFHWNRVQAVSW